MTKPVDGCEHRWPESAGDGWHARDALKAVVAWGDESHFILRGLACPHCACHFVSLFTETVDWPGGDDVQRWTLIPASADKFGRVASVVASSISAALREVSLALRSLRRDLPVQRRASGLLGERDRRLMPD